MKHTKVGFYWREFPLPIEPEISLNTSGLFPEILDYAWGKQNSILI